MVERRVEKATRRKRGKWLVSWTAARNIVLLYETLVSVGALVASMLLIAWAQGRLDQLSTAELVATALIFAPIALLSHLVFQTNRALWRFASVKDLLSQTGAIALAGAGLAALLLNRGAPLHTVLPETVVWSLLALAGVTGGRVVYRMTRDLFPDRPWSVDVSGDLTKTEPVILYGVGSEGERYLRETVRARRPRFTPVAIVADDPDVQHRTVQGVRVLGTSAELPAIAALLADAGKAPTRLLVPDDVEDEQTLRSLFKVANDAGMMLCRLPGLNAGVEDPKIQRRAAPVALSDLLGRASHDLDRESLSQLLGGARILVTGAGGSIGSELVRQIASMAPERLILVDSNEFNLYGIDHEIAASHPHLCVAAHVTNVRDRERLHGLVHDTKPDFVFHAAALKHVPLLEHQPEEAIATNVMGTCNVADACRAAGVRAMVLVSTDKAVEPTNVMGATKRLAEAYCQSLDRADPDGPAFFAVRFGNVLGSAGSVVPLFQKQLEQGGPLTVTHPDATRYFMTIPEAVQLILQALRIGTAAPERHGEVFVLDMGDPVRINDLAKQLIRQSGLKPGTDIQITYTGLRPGEKLHERLVYNEEDLAPTQQHGILRTQAETPALNSLTHLIRTLTLSAQDIAADSDDVRGTLFRVVAEVDRPARKGEAVTTGEVDMPHIRVIDGAAAQ